MTQDPEGEALLLATAELIVDVLRDQPREDAKRAILEMFQRHLIVRGIVSSAFDTARAVARVVDRRAGKMPDIAGANAILTAMRTGASPMNDSLAKLIAADIATVATKHERTTAAAVVEAFARRADRARPSEVEHLLRADYEAASRALNQGFNARSIGYVVALEAVAFFVEFTTGKIESLLSRNALPDGFMAYMCSGQDTKRNVPQQVVALALALMRFQTAEVYALILQVRRAVDPRASVDRAQIRRLTAPVRNRSGQRPTVRS